MISLQAVIMASLLVPLHNEIALLRPEAPIYVDTATNRLPVARELSSRISMSCQVLIKNGLAEQPGNSQYPAFHLSHRALDWLQEGREAAFVVGAPKPRSDAVGVMLVTGAVLGRKSRGSMAWDGPRQ
jgi:hypothetical protein